jgi:hypothetical protein
VFTGTIIRVGWVGGEGDGGGWEVGEGGGGEGGGEGGGGDRRGAGG